MTITFKTDRAVQKKGFKAKFEIHPCGGEVNTEASLSSPVHPNEYFHNTNCTWVITAPPNMVVEFK